MFRLVCVLLVALVLAVPVWGQESISNEFCTAEVAADMMTLLNESVATAQTALDAGNMADWRDALVNIQSATAVMEAICADYYFEGSGKQVVGPVVFMDGVYKVKVTAEGGMAMMTFEKIGGRCPIALVSTSSSGGEAEDAMTFADCETLIEISGGAEKWTLAFELVARAE